MCISAWWQRVNTPQGTKINSQELGLMFSALPKKINNIVWMDIKYVAPTFPEYQYIFNESKIDMETYVSEYYDCDNFAVAILGLIRGDKKTSHYPFGLCFVTTPNGGGHAINLFVDNEKKVYYLEPQTDEVWLVKSEKKGYNPFFLLI